MKTPLISLLFALSTISTLFAQAPFVASNSWALGAPMPTAREVPFIGAIGTKIYVVGGADVTGVLGVNEIYDTTANTWSTGASLPTPRWNGASAVVNNILYAIGGSNTPGSVAQNTVEAYDPSTNMWSTKAPLPSPDIGVYAAAVNGRLYVIGGFIPASGWLSTLFSYDPASNSWTTLAPLSLAKSNPAVGVFGSTIIAAGGLSAAGVIPDTQSYNISNNTWSTVAPEPTAGNSPCFEAVGNTLYVAGGNPVGNTQSPQLNTIDAYDEATNVWTTGLPTMPYAIVNAGSASVGGLLYCIGGSNNGNPLTGTVFNYVQIYAPAALPPSVSPGGVISASGFGAFSSIAPGTFIEIYGSNLAIDTRGWTGADFNGVNAPTSLDGSSVSIAGQAAFVNYISPSQINALVPSNVPTGPQPLTVTTAAGTSSAYSVNVNPVEPGLLAPLSFTIGGTPYAVALFADGTYVLPTGAISGVTSRPANPGDIIVLYGIGFGPVTPDIPTGQLVGEANTLSDSFAISIGGLPAIVDYDGLAPSFTGLYQFNVQVPNVEPGNAAPLTFSVNGVPGTQTLYLATGN